MVFCYNPMEPAQTIQGINWALKQGNRQSYRKGTCCTHTDWLQGVNMPFLRLSPSAGALGCSLFSLPGPEVININQSINNCQNTEQISRTQFYCEIKWDFVSQKTTPKGCSSHTFWSTLHLHSTSFKPLQCTDSVFWTSVLSPVKHECQMFLNIILYSCFESWEMKVGFYLRPAIWCFFVLLGILDTQRHHSSYDPGCSRFHRLDRCAQVCVAVRKTK